MAGPTLVAQYFAKQASTGDANPLTVTLTTAPAAGDILVVKLQTWTTTVSMGAPSGGSQTYTSVVTAAPGGFNQWAAIYVAKVTGSPGTFTISSTPSASSRHSMLVEHWTSADIAATPAVNSVITGTTGQGSLTTTQDNSVVSWGIGDVNSKDPSTRVMLANDVFENVRDDHVGANGVDYYGYHTTTTKGVQTFGMSAPTGQQNVIAAVEILPAASGTTTPFTKDQAESYRVLNAVTIDRAERYRVFNAVAKDQVDSYRVLNGIVKDQSSTYRVFNSISKDAVDVYRVLNGFAVNKADSYRVLQSFTVDAIDGYRVYGGIVKDVVESYAVLSATQITKDVVERYRVYGSFTADLTDRYRVLNVVAVDSTDRYRILNGLAVDRPDVWRLFNAIGVDVADRWTVNSGTAFSKDAVERYRLFNAVVRDVAERYAVLGATPRVANATAFLGALTAVADLSPYRVTAYLDN